MLLFVACLTIYIIIYFCIIMHFWQIYMMYGHSEVHTGGTVQNCAIKFTLYANIMSVLAPPWARDCHCHVCEELCCCWTKLNKLNSTSIMWLFKDIQPFFTFSISWLFSCMHITHLVIFAPSLGIISSIGSYSTNLSVLIRRQRIPLWQVRYFVSWDPFY